MHNSSMKTAFRWYFYVNIKKIVNKEFFGMKKCIMYISTFKRYIEITLFFQVVLDGHGQVKLECCKILRNNIHEIQFLYVV